MVDYAHCNSCGGYTPVGGPTLVLARRIVIRTDHKNADEVLNGEACWQVCPECQMVSAIRQLDLKSSMPPFLDVEMTAALNYLKEIAGGREFPNLETLPLRCVKCHDSIHLGTKFVYVELSSDTTRGSLVDPKNKVAVANVCSNCADETWGVSVEQERLSSTPCSSSACPACAPLR